MAAKMAAVWFETSLPQCLKFKSHWHNRSSPSQAPSPFRYESEDRHKQYVHSPDLLSEAGDAKTFSVFTIVI
jgi:hypothetical protein